MPKCHCFTDLAYYNFIRGCLPISFYAVLPHRFPYRKRFHPFWYWGQHEDLLTLDHTSKNKATSLQFTQFHSGIQWKTQKSVWDSYLQCPVSLQLISSYRNSFRNSVDIISWINFHNVCVLGFNRKSTINKWKGGYVLLLAVWSLSKAAFGNFRQVRRDV